MDNTTTPRLVELVTRAQAIAKALNYIAGLARQMEVRQGCHKAMLESDFIASALSRLMAEGGLNSRSPLGPEEEGSQMLEVLAMEYLRLYHDAYDDPTEAQRRVQNIRAGLSETLTPGCALAAMRAWGSRYTPIDDRAVERALMAFYSSDSPAYEGDQKAAMRLALQAALAAAPTSPQPINGESELESASNGMGLR